MYKKGTGNDKQGKDAGNRTLCPYRNFSQAINFRIDGPDRLYGFRSKLKYRIFGKMVEDGRWEDHEKLVTFGKFWVNFQKLPKKPERRDYYIYSSFFINLHSAQSLPSMF